MQDVCRTVYNSKELETTRISNGIEKELVVYLQNGVPSSR